MAQHSFTTGGTGFSIANDNRFLLALQLESVAYYLRIALSYFMLA